jgi:hypothetical protein
MLPQSRKWVQKQVLEEKQPTGTGVCFECQFILENSLSSTPVNPDSCAVIHSSCLVKTIEYNYLACSY